MELLLTPESWPFTFSVILVVLIGLVETVSLLIGASLAGALDHLALFHADALADSWLGWLHFGKVPMLVLLIIMLTVFALLGFTFNLAFHGLLGVYPEPLLSSGVAFLVALPVVRACGGVIARIIPKDETSAVLLETLVGNVAVVVNGTARVNYPAQARVKNEQGQTFYIHVEPDDENVQFTTGESVLLIKQISGARFLGIANPRPDLL
ncbi:MAG: YqiJ family protein [Candidatus Methylumidiphilus sp.]|nr:YqiJ family protein [Pseudomonadota bacterium]